AFIGGSWSDSGEEYDEKSRNVTCLMAQASSEVHFESSYFSDENSSIDDIILDSEYNRAYNGDNVIFGSNLRGNIIGKGQICDNKCKVIFSEHDSEITKDGKVIGRGIRKSSLYVIKLGKKTKDKICLTTIVENSTLWHRILGHANMRLIQSLASKELVRNLPKLKFDQHFCNACKIGKQAHASHKAKNIVLMTRYLELLHMDLFSPSNVQSYEGNLYILLIVDNYSRMDHGRKFDNEVQFGEFCNANGITHNFSDPQTPQSNGVVERKNRTLQKMSKTMLNEQSLPQNFWCNAIETSTYILNRIINRAILGKTPYELLRDMCDEFAKIMHDEFKMSMLGELNFFFGLQIKQMEDGIFFNQSKHIKEMLKKFGLEESQPMKTPMSLDTKLIKDEECESVDNTKYRGMIGSVLYLAASRPDIMFSGCLCARFQEDPKTSHLEAVKRIF
nr:hypothetical protein [Tanacetum cinerariifolium]